MHQMNCRPGDVAMVVRVGPGMKWALGRVVRVTCLHLVAHVPTWELEEPLVSPNVYKFTLAEDCCLRPLRHHPEDDESLAWVGRPTAGRPQGMAA